MLVSDANVSHLSKGRIRVRIPKKLGDAEFFLNLKKKFSELSGIQSISYNPDSASILLLTNLPAKQVFDFAKNRDLFILDETQNKTNNSLGIQNKNKPKNTQNGKSGLKRLAYRLSELDKAIQNSTNGFLDLTTLAFTAFAGLGIYQIARGHILASGTSLIASACTLIPLQKMMEEKKNTDMH